MTTVAAVASPFEVGRPDLVIDLSRFAATIDATWLDTGVVNAVKTNILDTLSCALAGSSKAIAEVSRQNPVIASTPCTTRLATTFWRMPMPGAAPTRARRVSRRPGFCGHRGVWVRVVAG
jgi:hypothetical protein